MTDNKVFIEQRIIEAVKGLLTGQVNEIFGKWEFLVPVIEFGNIGSNYTMAPVVTVSGCEQTEKDLIIRLDAYTVVINLTLQEHEDGEMFCYAYSGAVGRALYDDPTIGGIADRAVVTGEKYLSPKKPNCGEGLRLEIYRTK